MDELLNHRYRILQTLGDGGFGKTFLAEDTHLPSSRRCVIKQLKPVTDRPQIYQLVKERFQREAAILETLGESNAQIPKLYAYFEAEGLFYLVQEWIDGITLTQALYQQKQRNETEIRTLLISLLNVLDYIHQRGIIHRDIKPDNIMLRRSTHSPVLIDFGAVKETVQTVLNSQGQPTRSIIIGTPGYMPQEQAVGKPVFASDLYSLGLTVIYLLTGKSPPELEVHPQTGEYLWRMHAPQISAEFADILDRAIQSHVRDRYATAQEMLSALQAQTRFQAASAHAATIVPPTVAHSPSAPSTMTTPAQPAARSLDSGRDSGRQSNPIILGSLIAGSLIGTSIILGLVLIRPFQSPRSQPTADLATSSPQQLDTPQSSNQTPAELPEQNTQSDILTPTISPIQSPPTPSDPGSTQADVVTWLSTRPVTDTDLFGKNAFELDVLRNTIYAKHGRRFNDEALQTYFNSQPWYKPIYSPEEFPVNLLSNLEKQNAQAILNYQDRNGLR